ncbi:Cell division protein FtsZ-like protein 2-1 [Forsythia ovata]|uniref:Cell division protein FtsZ-like protein 2-1 n=1 Tax=Forsythia ovata TaxID=205694 RepID=A0ABD1WF05_9LAMI
MFSSLVKGFLDCTDADGVNELKNKGIRDFSDLSAVGAHSEGQLKIYELLDPLELEKWQLQYLMPPDTRRPMGVLNVLGGRVAPLKMADEKSGLLGISQKVGSSVPRFKCSINSHSVNQFQGKDPFLNLHPEISMLRGKSNTTMTNPRHDSLSGSVTKSVRDSSSLNNFNEAKIKVIGVGGGGSNAVNRMIESAMKGVELWIVNTDIQAMRMSPVFFENRLQIGQELTIGLGDGGNPDIGMNAAKLNQNL